ncbi:hypothetical protein GCM10017566_61240 [Amycolatopsis bartoniae]|uniref:Uncharacterized protein n=1 Tax=Amycolatopsis bartoniae TaxID=941986 RepID=A0A8H9J1H1_9PSEU|nr:hypothetical protein GCM10017566_61240 [Amycolatopsis bartoniae]
MAAVVAVGRAPQVHLRPGVVRGLSCRALMRAGLVRVTAGWLAAGWCGLSRLDWCGLGRRGLGWCGLGCRGLVAMGWGRPRAGYLAYREPGLRGLHRRGR